MDNYDYSIYYARFHDDSVEHAEQHANWLAQKLTPHLPSDHSAKIVDIGCGYGFALRALRNLGYLNLVGLETSESQAARSRSAGFLVEVGDNSASWLGKHQSEFSLALLLDVLEHQPTELQIGFLKAIHSALTPGGKLLLTVPNANAILDGRWRYNDFTHYSSFTEHSLYFVLKNAGFDDIHIDSAKGLDRPSLRIWKRGTWPAWRKYLVRWCWLQVFKAEIPWERIEDISFELNLTAAAVKHV